MEKQSHLWIRKLRILYIILALIAFAVASGAPGAGSGALRSMFFF